MVGEHADERWHEERHHGPTCCYPAQQGRLLGTANLAGGNKEDDLCRDNNRDKGGNLKIEGEPQNAQSKLFADGKPVLTILYFHWQLHLKSYLAETASSDPSSSRKLLFTTFT